MNRQEWNGRPRSHIGRKKRAGETVLLVVSILLLAAGAAGLGHVFLDRQAAEETNREQRALYYGEGAETAGTAEPAAARTAEAPASARSAEPTAAAEPAEGEAARNTELPAAAEPPEPAAEPGILAPVPYPANPARNVGERFLRLKEKNPDIVGWIKTGSMLDEAVVQRDNEFYMDHDSSGRKNVNGAVFMDEGVSLETRPYTLILYAHNMKSGIRFGNLRNYENPEFYRKYPFITFNTQYEDGRYVVFSAGLISTDEKDPDWLDFYRACSDRTDERREIISLLNRISRISTSVDVRPEDQLLLLTTCADKDEERRVVAARRIRDGEDVTALERQIRQGK